MYQPTTMRDRFLFILALILAMLPSCIAPSSSSHPDTQTEAGDSAYTVVATGLNQPRGMTFDAQGNLYVAEAGARDAPSPAGAPWAPTPDPNQELPELNHSGRVLQFTPDGHMTTVLDGLPYTYYPVSGDVGATDVVVHDGILYVLTGEGYDDELSRMVLRVPSGGARADSSQRIANIRHFAENYTPMEEMMRMGGAASNPYAMVVAPYYRALGEPDRDTGNDTANGGGDIALYVTDGATGRILRITLDGEIRLFAELGNLLPIAGLAVGPDNRLYVTMFSERPHTTGSGAIWAADQYGELTLVASDLTMPIDVDFAPHDRANTMYVLEFGSSIPAQQLYAPGRGRLLRLQFAPDGTITRTVLLDELNYPSSMTFAPNGDLYIAVGGAFTTAGQGAILTVPCLILSAPDACE